MKIFIDFDDVLFDTAAFSRELKAVFDTCGVSADLFHKTYEKARERKNIHVYSYSRQITILEQEYNIESSDIESAVDKLLSNTTKFIFDDVEDFLCDLCKRDHELYLVTFGSFSIQNGKIQGSGLNHYFKENLIGEIDKGEKIKEFLGEEDGSHCLFLEDRAKHIENVKAHCPQIVTILVRRPEGRYHDNRTDSCDFTAESLSDVAKIIKKLS